MGGSGSLVEVRLGTGSRETEQLSPGPSLVCDGTRGWAACAGWGGNRDLLLSYPKATAFFWEGA